MHGPRAASAHGLIPGCRSFWWAEEWHCLNPQGMALSEPAVCQKAGLSVAGMAVPIPGTTPLRSDTTQWLQPHLGLVHGASQRGHKRDGEALERLEMSQRAVGRDIRNRGQGEQAGRKPPRMGDEEEVAAHVFVFAVSLASWCRLEARLRSGCMDTVCRMLLQVAGAKTPVPSGAAPTGAQVCVETLPVG